MFSRTQRFLAGEIIGWLALAGLLLMIGRNFTDVRRVVFETATGLALKPSIHPAAAKTASGASEKAQSSDSVELRADRQGHFAANMEVNGRAMDGMVDTGASLVMLTYEDAERAGIFLRASDFTMQAQTANGLARIAPITLDRLAIGPILVRNVKAGVGERGLLNTNLIGMSFLQKLQTFEIRSGTLVLKD